MKISINIGDMMIKTKRATTVSNIVFNYKNLFFKVLINCWLVYMIYNTLTTWFIFKALQTKHLHGHQDVELY